MRTPSILNILMCALDVVFNGLLIFPARMVRLGELSFTMPGAGLGVTGAALGTACHGYQRSHNPGSRHVGPAQNDTLQRQGQSQPSGVVDPSPWAS